MEIFKFNDYKDYVKALLKSLPKSGHGESNKIAKAIGVNPTMVSQILNGKAQLSQDQAVKLARHLNLNPNETQYLINLVLLGRSATQEAKTYFQERLDELKDKSQAVKDALNLKSELSDEHRPIFYSSWYYSAVWLLTAIEDYQTKDQLAERIKLPVKRLMQILNFVTDVGLVINQDGKFKIEVNSIFFNLIIIE